MALPVSGGLFSALAVRPPWARRWVCGGGGVSLITEQASLDPMDLAPGGMAAQAITAPHGAWRQLEMADAHWPSAIKQLGRHD